MSNNPWDNIDYHRAMDTYNRRYQTHQKLLNLFNSCEEHDYVYLALGITDDAGNFSANRHHLGDKILSDPNAQKRVFALAQQFYSCEDPNQIPDIIYNKDIPYLKISVGSEMAMMLKPDLFWVDNIRTMWAKLVITKDLKYAEDNLKAYTPEYQKDFKYQSTSDLSLRYSLWKQEYPGVGSSMKKVADHANIFALNEGIPSYLIPINTFLWPDAVVDTAFSQSKWMDQDK